MSLEMPWEIFFFVNDTKDTKKEEKQIFLEDCDISNTRGLYKKVS